MFYIKNSLALIFCLFTFGVIAQNTSVSGNLSTALEAPMPNISVTIKSGDFTATTMTNEVGNFSIENITAADDLTFEIEVDNNDNPLNGVSTFDYVLGAKHILGITPFDMAFKYIAMDINGSGSITAFDLVQMRNLILGITTEFPNNTAWRFIEKTQLEAITFSQTNTPEYEGDLSASYSLTSGENTHIDLIGIKIGDASGNATTN